MITIVDYGLGNLGSIHNMFRRIGADCVVTADGDAIRQATKLVLPGVGAFDNGMNNLSRRGLVGLLSQKVLIEGCPIMGICLGAQLMTRSSEEGAIPGLGWVPISTVRFPSRIGDRSLKIPHMGWNEALPVKTDVLFEGFVTTPRFYFVHGYHFVCEAPEAALTVTEYGMRFVSAFSCGNIYGVQFHPEKSHKFGMKLFENFARL